LNGFFSLEQPSRQRFEPISGFDRERRGAEFALTWRRLGMSPVMVKPFVAWESVKSVDTYMEPPPATLYQLQTANMAESTDRAMVGTMAAFVTQRSKGDWGIGLNAAFHGAFGRTSVVDLDASDWRIARLQAGLRFLTPVGPFRISAEDGRLQGNYNILDAFHFGGQNTGLVSDALDLNRVQQPAIPAYLMVGDRMRRLRAEYGSSAYLYFEKTAVWFADGQNEDYQRVVGFEVADGLSLPDMLSFTGLAPTLRIGLHRPLDGVMKNKTVFTMGIHFKF
jgi:hypothetical protein